MIEYYEKSKECEFLNEIPKGIFEIRRRDYKRFKKKKTKCLF